MLTLDVVVPTYNRRELLAKAVASLLRAEPPEGLAVTVIVVDNNCTDGTASSIQSLKPAGAIRLRYVKEEKQGISNARNGGIAAGSGELIGFVDDDEEVDPAWYKTVLRELRDSSVEYIGGPYTPNWGARAPDWLPPDYSCVIGVTNPQAYREYDESFPGILWGGNAVIRRTVFQRVGTYATGIGRTDKNLLSMEDDEFYHRLVRSGVRGRHVPDLVIRHYIPPERLTKSYHRRWCFWHAVSQGILDMTARQRVVYFAGVPRFMIGDAVRGLLSIPRDLWGGRPADAFKDELSLWNLAGIIYGAHFHDSGR